MSVSLAEYRLGGLRWIVLNGPDREAFGALGEHVRAELAALAEAQQEPRLRVTCEIQILTVNVRMRRCRPCNSEKLKATILRSAIVVTPKASTSSHRSVCGRKSEQKVKLLESSLR